MASMFKRFSRTTTVPALQVQSVEKEKERERSDSELAVSAAASAPGDEQALVEQGVSYLMAHALHVPDVFTVSGDAALVATLSAAHARRRPLMFPASASARDRAHAVATLLKKWLAQRFPPLLGGARYDALVAIVRDTPKPRARARALRSELQRMPPRDYDLLARLVELWHALVSRQGGEGQGGVSARGLNALALALAAALVRPLSEDGAESTAHVERYIQDSKALCELLQLLVRHYEFLFTGAEFEGTQGDAGVSDDDDDEDDEEGDEDDADRSAWKSVGHALRITTASDVREERVSPFLMDLHIGPLSGLNAGARDMSEDELRVLGFALEDLTVGDSAPPLPSDFALNDSSAPSTTSTAVTLPSVADALRPTSASGKELVRLPAPALASDAPLVRVPLIHRESFEPPDSLLSVDLMWRPRSRGTLLTSPRFSRKFGVVGAGGASSQHSMRGSYASSSSLSVASSTVSRSPPTSGATTPSATPPTTPKTPTATVQSAEAREAARRSEGVLVLARTLVTRVHNHHAHLALPTQVVHDALRMAQRALTTRTAVTAEELQRYVDRYADALGAPESSAIGVQAEKLEDALQSVRSALESAVPGQALLRTLDALETLFDTLITTQPRAPAAQPNTPTSLPNNSGDAPAHATAPNTATSASSTPPGTPKSARSSGFTFAVPERVTQLKRLLDHNVAELTKRVDVLCALLTRISTRPRLAPMLTLVTALVDTAALHDDDASETTALDVCTLEDTRQRALLRLGELRAELQRFVRDTSAHLRAHEFAAAVGALVAHSQVVAELRKLFAAQLPPLLVLSETPEQPEGLEEADVLDTLAEPVRQLRLLVRGLAALAAGRALAPAHALFLAQHIVVMRKELARLGEAAVASSLPSAMSLLECVTTVRRLDAKALRSLRRATHKASALLLQNVEQALSGALCTLVQRRDVPALLLWRDNLLRLTARLSQLLLDCRRPLPTASPARSAYSTLSASALSASAASLPSLAALSSTPSTPARAAPTGVAPSESASSAALLSELAQVRARVASLRSSLDTTSTMPIAPAYALAQIARCLATLVDGTATAPLTAEQLSPPAAVLRAGTRQRVEALLDLTAQSLSQSEETLRNSTQSTRVRTHCIAALRLAAEVSLGDA